MIQSFADWLVYDVFGLNAGTALGSSVNFFFYDTIKILILLLLISIIMGIINEYFPIYGSTIVLNTYADFGFAKS